MSKSTLSKNTILLTVSAAVLIISGCMATKKPGGFVESLRNPTSFPEIFRPEIKYIDEIVEEKSLGEDEDVMIIPLGQD
jgi:hypothetical protein